MPTDSFARWTIVIKLLTHCGGALVVQCGSGEHVVGLEGFYLRLRMIDKGFVVVVTFICRQLSASQLLACNSDPS